MLSWGKSLIDSGLINFKTKYVSVDNFVFKLHYRVTVTVLITGVALLSSQQYIGEQIRCISDDHRIEKVVERFCYFMATFTVDKHYNKSVSNREVPHPGVGPYSSTGEDIIRRHTYYQWVVFVLFFQAICFYLPHRFWKNMERGRINNLCTEITKDETMMFDAKTTIFKQAEFHVKNRLFVNRSWAFYLISAEALNVANLILQVYLTNLFLNGQFWDLGLNLGQKNRHGFNHLDVVFPKVTKCTFFRYGSSGSIQVHDIMCIMAMNIVNEKLFVFLWFWYLILFIFSIMVLIWRVISFFCRKRTSFNKHVFKFTALSKVDELNLATVMENVQFGEWMFLSYLASNLSPLNFNYYLSKLAESFERDYYPNEPAPKVPENTILISV